MTNERELDEPKLGEQGLEERARVAVLMARMAAGERQAIFDLYGEFGARLAAVMRRHLAAVGVSGATRDDLDGLVIEACLELASCAGAWRPDGGALPWTWAANRLRAVAARFVGVHADELDAAALDEVAGASSPPAPVAAHDEGSAFEVLAQAGAAHPMAALLLDALSLVGSPRDQAIVLELRLQTALGDPSPSHTVGAGLDTSPDAVRQVGSRMRRRLRELAASDERFAPLADLPLVA